MIVCAGLRKTIPGSVDSATAGPPAAAAQAAKAPRDAKAVAKKRKSVRFNIPAEGQCCICLHQPVCTTVSIGTAEHYRPRSLCLSDSVLFVNACRKCSA